MLSAYRVLDLTDHRGELAAMMLGDLGADVIKVEPPAGSAARQEGPRYEAASGEVTSLQFAAFNRNKRSIALDLADATDRDTLLALVASADFVLESGPPGELRRHGINFDTLKAANPQIVFVSITPWGVDGPDVDRVANDLTLSAMGGQAALQGSPDRAPVRVTVPQVWRHVGAEAAAAAMIAHHRRIATGQAQFVDLSAQCVVTWTTMNAMDAWAVQGFDFQRMGSTVQMGTAAVDPVFECADGHVVVLPTGAMLESLIGHMLGDEVIDADWLAEEWGTFDLRMRAGEPTLFTREQVREVFVAYLKRHTKRELFELGLEIGVTLAPVNTAADLLEFDQLEFRNAWTPVPLSDGQLVRGPGIFARSATAPLAIRRRAPTLDEHGHEVRRELADAPRAANRFDAAGSTDRPFEGLKVLDMTWVIAGPSTVRYLSDHGATVIKVESELRPDGVRLLGPVKGEDPWNSSHFYGEFNAGKQCVQLNLKVPEAVAILKRLIAWADVLVENWAPGAMDRLGVGWEGCRAINPDLVMVSTSLMGHSGPASRVAGYGYHAGGMAGFYEVTGWPDQPPHGPWLAYTDCIAPRFIMTLLGAALDHHRLTGEGQHIDASQFEMALQFLAPEIMETQTTGYVASRLGNRAVDRAPQGLYPCSGDDAWCAIAIDTDSEWQALVQVLGSPDWATAPGLATAEGRIADHDNIDARLSEWTAAREPADVMNTLTAVGVPAGALQRSSDLANDPRYLHRGFHKWQEHPVMGQVPYAGNQFNIPDYQAGPFGPAPMLGQHTQVVLEEVLGLTADEIASAAAAGALQ